MFKFPKASLLYGPVWLIVIFAFSVAALSADLEETFFGLRPLLQATEDGTGDDDRSLDFVALPPDSPRINLLTFTGMGRSDVTYCSPIVRTPPCTYRGPPPGPERAIW
jgi:hypothetical protein